jgi:hypothetical protein
MIEQPTDPSIYALYQACVENTFSVMTQIKKRIVLGSNTLITINLVLFQLFTPALVCFCFLNLRAFIALKGMMMVRQKKGNK